jgi:GNAT superfamily N-acetyltransferase
MDCRAPAPRSCGPISNASDAGTQCAFDNASSPAFSLRIPLLSTLRPPRLVSFAVRPEPDGQWIEHFYLAPEYQGHGLGSAVLRHVMGSEEDRYGNSR